MKIKKLGNSIHIEEGSSITFISEHVGSSEGSRKKDFYVYEWFIVNTNEIFYVGKGRGDRYKEYHTHAYEAERIRELYNTDIRFVGKNLTEDAALELETKEITRILNETNDRLTNRIIPFFTKRGNGYSKAQSTPTYQFETAPVLYVSEIDEHYYGTKWKNFDFIEIKNLGFPVILDKCISKEEIEIIYGGNYKKYYDEVIELLKRHGSKILKSKYAKSVSSWIYPCDDYVLNHELDEKSAIERIGHSVPTYHLIDVWNALVELYGKPNGGNTLPVEINPIHNRVPLEQIQNTNWEQGYDAGVGFWEKGEVERKAGKLEKAIELFDQARCYGYNAPALYYSYAMVYRKAKDLDNEIAILEEAIARLKNDEHDYSQSIITFEEQKEKAIEKLIKQKR